MLIATRATFSSLPDAQRGLVGPLGASSFSLPTVERALAEMESSFGRRADVGGLTLTSHIFWRTSPMQHEVLQNFFESLLNPEDRAASPGNVGGEPRCCRDSYCERGDGCE